MRKGRKEVERKNDNRTKLDFRHSIYKPAYKEQDKKRANREINNKADKQRRNQLLAEKENKTGRH